MSPLTAPDVVSGHFGHLSPDQAAALDTFKANLTKDRLWTPETGVDDPTLLRFLRARKWDPVKAQKQFTDTERWRKEHDVANLYATFDPDEFVDSKRFYPRWTGRRDKQGLPIYVYRLASLQGPVQKELDKIPLARRYQRIVALYEILTQLVLPLCSSIPHSTSPTPITSVTTIIDLDGVAYSSMWSLRSHLQQASTLATANYPETLCATIVVNAPSFFPTVWGWVKGWFDKGTRDKVHVLARGQDLSPLIDPKDLPKVYGGELEWVFEDEPALDEDAKEALGGTFPHGPCWWKDGKVVKPGDAPTGLQSRIDVEDPEKEGTPEALQAQVAVSH